MKLRALIGATAVALGAAMVTMPALAASAATAASSVPRATQAPTVSQGIGQSDGGVSSTALSTWQTNGIVFAMAYANGVLYVGGTFTSVRPPGDPVGTGEVPRTYLAAFNSSTGELISSFNPVITYSGTNTHPGVFALAVSPDGTTLYMGGIFDHVNGTYRSDAAALNTSTGALTSWNPAAVGKVDTLSVTPDGSAIYLGGNLSKLQGVARTDAGAVTSSGNLLPWAPALDSTVYSLAVAPDGSQVVLGGYFQHINGVAQNSAGAVDAVTGTTNWPWGLPPTFVPHNSSCQSAVKDVVISGSTAYLADEGNGGGCFDGDWALTLGSTDQLLWQNDCLGATQALEVVNGFLFKGSHAHDCAYVPGGFPQVSKPTGGWVTWHLLDQQLSDGTVGHWTPDTDVSFGSTWPGVGNLGPHAMATDGSQLFLGGDFTTVNGKPQEGFAIFPAANTVAPGKPTVAPTVTSTSAGIDSVRFPAVSSQDIGTLSYKIFRDGGRTPIATLTATSWPWALPVLHYQDKGLTPGSSHTYTYQAYDGTHGSAISPASASVTVSSTSPAQTYQQTVLADNPSFLWPLNDTSSTATDATSNGFNGTYEPGTTQGQPGPFSAAAATGFDGNSGLVTAQNQVAGPQQFSVEGWFNTSTDDGGKLIGFGNNQTGSSSSYDRHIYMMNDGQLVFGIWNNQTETIETPNVYNDGAWHYVVATYNGNNMALYVDGQLTGTNTSSSAQGYNGYWRVGGDNLNGWNLDPWGSNSQGTTQPHSYYFNGTIADVAVYPTALSAAQVAAHYAAGLNQQ